MALTKVVKDAVIAIADVNDIIDHLEGAAGSTLAWFLRVSTGNNFIIRLPETAGAQKFTLQNGSGTEVARIDSLGNLQFDGSLEGGKNGTVVIGTETSVTSSTTYTNVNDAVITISTGGEEYWFDFFITYEAHASGDMKIRFTSPANYLCHIRAIGETGGALALQDYNGTAVSTGDITADGGGAGTSKTIRITGILEYNGGGSDTGNFQMQMAQNSSFGTATIIHDEYSFFHFGLKV